MQKDDKITTSTGDEYVVKKTKVLFDDVLYLLLVDVSTNELVVAYIDENNTLNFVNDIELHKKFLEVFDEIV